jgi:hypothetical protein
MLGDLIEVDIEKLSARVVEQKGDRPPALNSVALVYNRTSNRLVLFGGVNDDLAAQLYYYTFDPGRDGVMQKNRSGPSNTQNYQYTKKESGSILVTLLRSCYNLQHNNTLVESTRSPPRRLLDWI